MRRPVLALVAAALLTLLTGLVGPAAPVGALNVGWTLTVEPPPAVVTRAPVVVTGRVDYFSLVGGLVDPVTAVTVRLVPTADGVPDACRTDALSRTVAPANGRYTADLRPPCNGPYRVEVTARTRNENRSGAPETATVKVADPGPAPAAPTAVGSTNGVLLGWAPAATPDVVGWRVTGGLAPVDYGPGTTSATVPASPGARQLALVARRWGADGPGGPEVTSPAATADTVDVQAPPDPDQVATPDLPAAAPPAAPPRRNGGAGPPAAPRTTTPSRSGATVPTRRPPTGTPEGYRENLPYGVPDEAFIPGEGDSSPSAADGDDERAGTSPSANVVRTRERQGPGLVAPFALALMLVTVATHIAWYLRRTRPSVPGQQAQPA